jgi:hypothetical protein
MANLATQKPSITGVAPVYSAAVGPDTFDCTGHEMIHAKNADAAPHTVSVNSLQLCNQGFDHDGGGSVPAGGERYFGPFKPGFFKDPATGKATITYPAGVTGLTLAVIQTE